MHNWWTLNTHIVNFIIVLYVAGKIHLCAFIIIAWIFYFSFTSWVCVQLIIPKFRDTISYWNGIWSSCFRSLQGFFQFSSKRKPTPATYIERCICERKHQTHGIWTQKAAVVKWILLGSPNDCYDYYLLYLFERYFCVCVCYENETAKEPKMQWKK